MNVRLIMRDKGSKDEEKKGRKKDRTRSVNFNQLWVEKFLIRSDVSSQ